ncbi:hypothetical protein CEXT_448581, partial [Caerostris extrusa]
MSKLGNVSVVIKIWMHIKAHVNELKYYKEKIEVYLILMIFHLYYLKQM